MKTNFIFKTGDDVIALSNKSKLDKQPRILGGICIIDSIINCHECNTQHINLGEGSMQSKFTCDCGHKQFAKALYLSNSSEFVLNDETMISHRLQSAIQNEEWSIAAMLRDHLNINNEIKQSLKTEKLITIW